MGRRRYLTRARVAAVAAELKPRDWAVVSDVARLRVVSGRQLRQLYYPHTDSGRRSARRDLSRLVELRALARLNRRIGGVRSGSDGYVYALDVVGQRLLELGRRRYRQPWTPSAQHLDHVLAVSQLYVDIRTRGSDWHLLSFDTEPRCWRSFSGPGGARVVLKPDAYLVGATREFEDSWFVEVDRATESLPRVTDKAKRYVDYWQRGAEQEKHGVFPRALWVVPDEPRRAQLHEGLGKFDAEHWQLFGVTTTAEAAQRITGELQPADGGTS